MKQSPYQLLMGVVLLGTVAFLSWQAGGLAAAGMQYIQSENGPGEQKQAVVVIDPGHGGCNLRDLKNQNRIAACMLREVGRPLSCGLCNY